MYIICYRDFDVSSLLALLHAKVCSYPIDLGFAVGEKLAETEVAFVRHAH